MFIPECRPLRLRAAFLKLHFKVLGGEMQRIKWAMRVIS